MVLRRSRQEHGFAGIEAVLVVVIIGIVVGVGYWVATQRKADNAAVSTSATPNSTQTVDPAKKGTTEGIDQLTQADSQSEDAIDTQFGANEQTSATGSNTAQNNIGGAYDESSF